MPPVEDGEEVSRKRSHEAPKRAVSECGHNLTTIIIQALLCAAAATDRVLRPLLHKSGNMMAWNANAGQAVELLLRSMGLDFS